MHLAPYEEGKPLYYEFTTCPTAEFAKKHDLLEVMPALCNPNFTAMELLHARLVRITTLLTSRATAEIDAYRTVCTVV